MSAKKSKNQKTKRIIDGMKNCRGTAAKKSCVAQTAIRAKLYKLFRKNFFTQKQKSEREQSKEKNKKFFLQPPKRENENAGSMANRAGPRHT